MSLGLKLIIKAENTKALSQVKIGLKALEVAHGKLHSDTQHDAEDVKSTVEHLHIGDRDFKVVMVKLKLLD